MIKSLKDISWNVTEEEYRQDKALSYSTLAKFKRSGFNEISHLFDKIETPSLTFGSAVDSIITGGDEEFNSRFIVAEHPVVPPAIESIAKDLFQSYKDIHKNIEGIPDSDIIEVASKYGYQNNWKPETRAKVIKEKGSVYYKLLYLSKDKTILNTETYADVCNTVEALRTFESTKWYFQKDNPFENVERCYQLKFKATLNGVDYRCMADLIVIDHDKKLIIPVDLKTSSKPEWDFYKSFVDWDYQIQSRLYYRIIRDNLDRDPYFKDFELADYRFIVANRKTLTPLVWNCEFTKTRGKLEFKSTTFEDPEDIGKTLDMYLKTNPKVPNNIKLNKCNSLTEWLNQ